MMTISIPNFVTLLVSVFSIGVASVCFVWIGVNEKEAKNNKGDDDAYIP